MRMLVIMLLALGACGPKKTSTSITPAQLEDPKEVSPQPKVEEPITVEPSPVPLIPKTVDPQLIPVTTQPIAQPLPVTPLTGVAITLDTFQECFRVTLDICEMENDLLEAVNDYRTIRGILPFVASEQAALIARRWSTSMSASGIIEPIHPVVAADSLNMSFGPESVIIGNGNNGSFVVDASVLSAPITATASDLFALLIASEEDRLSIASPYERATAIGIFTNDTTVYVTLLYMN